MPSTAGSNKVGPKVLGRARPDCPSTVASAAHGLPTGIVGNSVAGGPGGRLCRSEGLINHRRFPLWRQRRGHWLERRSLPLRRRWHARPWKVRMTTAASVRAKKAAPSLPISLSNLLDDHAKWQFGKRGHPPTQRNVPSGGASRVAPSRAPLKVEGEVEL